MDSVPIAYPGCIRSTNRKKNNFFSMVVWQKRNEIQACPVNGILIGSKVTAVFKTVFLFVFS